MTQLILNNALPFNQPWGVPKLQNISGDTAYIYMGALPNIIPCYLKETRYENNYKKNTYYEMCLYHGSVSGRGRWGPEPCLHSIYTHLKQLKQTTMKQ